MRKRTVLRSTVRDAVEKQASEQQAAQASKPKPLLQAAVLNLVLDNFEGIGVEPLQVGQLVFAELDINQDRAITILLF